MYYLNPDVTKASIGIFYRNFQAKKGSNCSHIGLGVNAVHTCKVFRANKVRADPFGVWTPEDVETILKRRHDITHAIIEAPWIPSKRMQEMMFRFPAIHFIVRCHSQIGFLQVEAGAIKIIRDLLHLQEVDLGLTVAGNSKRFCHFIERTYHARCLYLPNLYDAVRVNQKPQYSHHHRVVRIASFGALRLLKLHTTAAAAALYMARARGNDLEFYVSVNREEHGAGVLQALKNMFAGVPWAVLKENPWSTWSEFRHVVSHMDLCIQMSATETFNIVTADAAAEMVPSVVSEAIEWTPPHWLAHIDDPHSIARVGMGLLNDPDAGKEGYEALLAYMQAAIHVWLKYLASHP